MPAPRVTIDALPEKVALTGGEWFVVQDGTASKKVSAAHVGTGDTGGGGGGGDLPDGGTTGQVLGKLSNANQDVGWQSPLTGPAGPAGAAGAGLPTGGAIGQFPRKSATADYITSWVTLAKADVGLGNVDNTADANKPIFTTTTRGVVPPPGAPSSTSYLNANGGWTTPAGGTPGLPAGGVVGQILGKTGSADYAVGWVADQVGTGGGVDAEAAVDAVAVALVAGNNIDIVYDDAANGGLGTITIDVEPLTTTDISGLTPAASMALPVSVANGGTGASTFPTNFVQGNGTSPMTATKAVPTGAVVGTSDSQTLTNKGIDLANNSVVGTVAQFNSAISDGNLVPDTRAITTAAPLAGGGPLTADLALSIATFTASTRGAVPNPGGTSTGRYLKDDATWATFAAGTSGIVQSPTAPGDITVLWADTSQVGIEENVRYLSTIAGLTYTLVLGDRGKLLLCSNSAAQTITVPTNATAAFVVGTQLDLVQTGAGLVSVIGASGVTVNGVATALPFRARYSAASLIKTATNTWLLLGDTAA